MESLTNRTDYRRGGLSGPIELAINAYFVLPSYINFAVCDGRRGEFYSAARTVAGRVLRTRIQKRGHVIGVMSVEHRWAL